MWIMFVLLVLGPGLLGMAACWYAAVHPTLYPWRWHICLAVAGSGIVLGIPTCVLVYHALFRKATRLRLRHTSKSGCPECDYNLLGIIDDSAEQVRCPECGQEFASDDLRFVCSYSSPSASSGSDRGWSWEGTADTSAARWLGVLLLLLGYGQWITTAQMTGPSVYSLVLLCIVSSLGIRLAFAGPHVWRRRWIDGINSGFAMLFPALVGGYPPSVVAFGFQAWIPTWACIAIAFSCIGLVAHTLMSNQAKAKLVRMWDPTHRAGR